MNNQRWKKLIKENRILYVDGATGSNLIRKGMPSGVCPELWILQNEDIMLELQTAYIEAGSDIIYAPTFTANRIKLSEYDLGNRVDEMNRKLVAISRKAAGDSALVAGDISMTGRQLEPMGDLAFEELINVYKEQVMALNRAGVDLIVIETMMSLQETRAAVIAVKESCDLPIMVTFTFEKDGRTLYGTNPETAAAVMESLMVDAVGANCSAGPDQMLDLIRKMAKEVNIPIIAKPNAGLPYIQEDGMTAYDMMPEPFAESMVDMVLAGAVILGGCCGTDPCYIKAMKERLKEVTLPGTKKVVSKRRLTSERKTLSFTLEDPFIVIGERINPTGKKAFQETIRNHNYEMALKFAEEQEENGAGILDINLGMSGIDEKTEFLNVMQEVLNITSLPLSIDSSNADVVEAALRIYPGRALVNSVSLEKGKCERLLPLVKKYGAMFILLPLSDEGLPKSKEEKIEIIKEIIRKAEEVGLTREEIIVDGLVTTIGANPKAAKETLEVIEYCKANGLATTCGLSNVSFGLPERVVINTAFLTMAIERGLTMAIANPMQEMIRNAVLSSDMLLEKENASVRYIEGITASGSASGKAVLTEVLSVREQLKKDVLKGNRQNIVKTVQTALGENNSADELLNEVLLPAIAEVGSLFELGHYFLPQLIASAEAMKTAVEYLEQKLTKTGNQNTSYVVIIATVKGDIHDIGKNLVALMLKNYGFLVHDLGKDVDAQLIVETAIKENAAIIALSALMTTTMKEMKNVINLARKEGYTGKIMIGGAVITKEYATEIGSDGYSKDAQEAVRVARELLGL